MVDENDIAKLLVDDECLHGFMREHIRWVADCLADGDHDSWVPMLAVMAKASVDDPPEMIMYALAVDFNEQEEKHAAMTKVGKDVYDKMKIPVAAVLSAEVWGQKRRLGTNAPYCEPRHDPAREEGICIFGMRLQKGAPRAISAFAPVERTSNGMIAIGEFGEIETECRSPLLEVFFRGFYESVLAGRSAN